MFDFMDSDAFVIGLEIVFLTFIAYDGWKYYKTRQKSYLLNIILAIGFAAWVLYPFYHKYYGWEEKERQALDQQCLQEHNQSYCTCVDNAIFKGYDQQDFLQIDRGNDEGYLLLLKEAQAECFDK
jgi:hypothetical protein